MQLHHHALRFLSILILVLTQLACAGTPLVPEYQNALRRSEVETLSTALQAEIESHYQLLQHKLINRYVNSVGQSIIARNEQMPPLPYEFRVLRTKEAHVFSLPGGIVYVTLGMLSAVKLEGQFAAALAHELAHQDAGHPLIIWRDRIRRQYGSGTAEPMERKASFRSHFFSVGGLMYYGDAMEQEADEIAMVLLYRAGYDPRAYISYLQNLDELQTNSRRWRERLSAMSDMHPPLQERVAWADAQLRRLPPKREMKLTTSAFREIKRRLQLADKMEQEKEDGTPD